MQSLCSKPICLVAQGVQKHYHTLNVDSVCYCWEGCHLRVVLSLPDPVSCVSTHHQNVRSL